MTPLHQIWPDGHPPNLSNWNVLKGISETSTNVWKKVGDLTLKQNLLAIKNNTMSGVYLTLFSWWRIMVAAPNCGNIFHQQRQGNRSELTEIWMAQNMKIFWKICWEISIMETGGQWFEAILHRFKEKQLHILEWLEALA